jgi:hypothetical protein
MHFANHKRLHVRVILGIAVTGMAIARLVLCGVATNERNTGVELTREILACMQHIRRQLRNELALDIRISQSDAPPRMLECCAQSTNAETCALGEHLSELSGIRRAPPALTEAQLVARYMERYTGTLRG